MNNSTRKWLLWFSLAITALVSLTAGAQCPEGPDQVFAPLSPLRLLIIRESGGLQIGGVTDAASRGQIHIVSQFSDADSVGLNRVTPTYLADTLELPDRFNVQEISRIKAGTYKGWVRTDNNKKRIQLMNVPGRTCVQLHVGNRTSEIAGCILLGDQGMTIAGKDAVVKGNDGRWRYLVNGAPGALVPEEYFVSVVANEHVVWNSEPAFDRLWSTYGSNNLRPIEVKIID